MSSPTTLRSAALATVNAKSLKVTLSVGVDVIYQAPDRSEQIEHGEASSASANSGGTASTSEPYPDTVIQIFIGQRDYEATGPTGQAVPFSVSARCPGENNAAEYVLGILRAIAASTNIHPSGNGYAFAIPKGGAVPFPINGVATIASGFVDSISVNSNPAGPPDFTITAINSAPPVTAPTSAAETQVTCSPPGQSSSSSGSSSGTESTSSTSTGP